MGAVNLKLDWATHEAARIACERWHYSRRLPLPPHVRIGVWEDGQYVGCVLFSRGASPGLLTPYGLDKLSGCELTRIAMREHRTPVSRILSVCLRMLKKASPGVRLVVSFADPEQGHAGGIYQAAGWIYSGRSKPELQFFDGSRWLHRREAVGRVCFGKRKRLFDWRNAKSRLTAGKHRYLMPLDSEMRDRIAHLAKPYPKRAGSAAGGTSGVQPEGGGSTPTPALSSSQK